MVTITFVSKQMHEMKGSVLIGLFEDEALPKECAALDKKHSNVISNAISKKIAQGKEGQIVPLALNEVVLIGLGKRKEDNLRKITNIIGASMRAIRSLDIKNCSLYLSSFDNSFALDDLLEKTTLAIHLGLYQYNDYKTKDKDMIKTIDSVTLLVDKKDAAKAASVMERATIEAEAVLKTRDLVNTPPNVAVPIYAAEYAKKLAAKNKLAITIFDEKKLKELGLNCYVAVAQASSNPPRMVVLEYKGSGNDAPIVLIGKGITFDTGGINTKPQPSMLTMKDDKAGACAVLHVIEACVRLKLKINVIGIGAFAENAVSGNAYKPDDIITSYSGITVEVLHSDAEGRMVLCDAIAYAIDAFKPKAVIDIATLTGAAIVATGYLVSPVMGTNQKLIDDLIASGERSFDRLWQLPLWDEHDEILKSDIADIKHVAGDMDAGTIIGAVFLKQFVKEVPWAHLDVAATVLSKADKGYRPKGATGFGVLLLLDYLANAK